MSIFPRALVLLRSAVAMLTLAVTFGLASRAAAAFEARDLVGWWTSVDDTFPALIRAETIVPMEELLVIGDDGVAESRVMKFQPASVVICALASAIDCSDAPLAGRARLMLDGK